MENLESFANPTDAVTAHAYALSQGRSGAGLITPVHERVRQRDQDLEQIKEAKTPDRFVVYTADVKPEHGMS